MQSFWLAIAATAMTGGGVYLLLRNRPRPSPGPQSAVHLANPGKRSDSALARSPSQFVGNRLPVMSYDELLQHTGTQSLIRSIRDKTGATTAAFQKSWQPTLQAAAEFVQLLPASESHHHANPGGLWLHMLECVDFALNLRRGVILPVGAPPEDVMRQEHRWTFGVFLGALLHDIGRPIADLRITRYDAPDAPGKPWQPIAGSLIDFGSSHYSVDFTDPIQRNYENHKRIGAILLQRLVTQEVLQWLSEDHLLMFELNSYLSGESSSGPIAELSRQADQESVRRNLLEGPRTRFASARAVPLIERLMEALRRQLADNVLPLNRAGAMGFVGQDSIWFIAKPVADSVREYLAKNESSSGIPGEDKNDRLFDCWQEYGAILPNPETNGAIWTVRLVSETLPESMANQSFTVLRFPLGKLYSSERQYPRIFSGEIVVVPRNAKINPVPRGDTKQTPIVEQADTGAVECATVTSKQVQASPELPSQAGEKHEAIANSTGAEAYVVNATDTDDPFADSVAETISIDSPNNIGNATPLDQCIAEQQSTATVKATQSPPLKEARAKADDAEEWLDEPAPIGPVSQPKAKTSLPIPQPHRRVAAPVIKPGLPKPTTAQPQQQAAPINKKPAKHQDAEQRSAGENMATHARPLPAPQSNATLPPIPGRNKKEPTPAAIDFMRWIQQGICDGTLLYNDSGALVHFVTEGMLLVSPAIFRRYAELFGEPARRSEASAQDATTDNHGTRLGLSIQRDVIDAGWHMQMPKKNNIARYQVQAKGGRPGKLLSGVLIQQPERWLNPLPPANPLLSKVKNEILTSLAGGST